jgi:hypothetical protein
MPKMATAVMTSMMMKPFLRRNQTNPNRLALISLLASVASFMPHHSQLFHFVRQNFGIESATSSFWQVRFLEHQHVDQSQPNWHL